MLTKATYVITIMFLLMAVPSVSVAQNSGTSTVTSDTGDATKQAVLKTLKQLYDDAKRLQKEGKYTEARVLFLKVKEMAKSVNSYSEMLDYRIAQCYEGEGDFENAIKHYEIYLGAKQVSDKWPPKREVRAKIRRLRKELAASSMPHDTSSKRSSSDSDTIEEDVTPPDQIDSSSGQTSPTTDVSSSAPVDKGSPGDDTPPPAPYPPSNSKRPPTDASWLSQYGPYVVLGLAATLVLVGMLSSGGMHSPSGDGSVPPDSTPHPPAQSPSQGGFTVLSW